jgi:hypothetical protein
VRVARHSLVAGTLEEELRRGRVRPPASRSA